ncbi:calmodulin NDAI_0A05130 [Naumovozyma dairenensis CBS 421]|uniref:EF-hand domain-containing protein n=1 Tax=Naumovozyma dairenensis (strain ATCC 10597 / BCRC 20456 / CBS 421 / NBRC 0211 / NRRL Y-12639) TaxID=1071378 RepID=G0W4D0_NAUDC|nr:hypothetical protein NDAI_0A05130 [Naumovozyma dairenensis CBS 421]CCD22668.1 hypothetical protein NDAI_0A05130 [Naumovozyma dairenensis CBS 421]
MNSLGLQPTEEEVTDLMNEVDIDGNHQIEFNEFISLMSRQSKSNDSEQELLEAFKVFDKNGDGHISADELKYVLNSLNEKWTDSEVDAMIKEVGGDTGEIDIQQFASLLSK